MIFRSELYSLSQGLVIVANNGVRSPTLDSLTGIFSGRHSPYPTRPPRRALDPLP